MTAAPPAVAAGDSLLDAAAPATTPATTAPPAAGSPEAIAAARAIVAEADKAAAIAADPNSGKAWNLTENQLGVGEKPAWFKQEKYKTVAEQAAAYPELEKRFGSFTGAPRDAQGNIKYETPPMADVVITNPDHPLLKEFAKVAGEMQLNQAGYNKLLGMMAQYDASMQVPIESVPAQLGADGYARIAQVSAWAKANLEPADYQLMRTATSDGRTAAAAFVVLERVIAKTGQIRMPKPGEDSAGNTGGKTLLQQADELQTAKNAKGQRLYEIDPKVRQEVERLRTEHFTANPVNRDRMGNRRG